MVTGYDQFVLKILLTEPLIKGNDFMFLSARSKIARMYQNITLWDIKLEVAVEGVSVTHTNNSDPKKEVTLVPIGINFFCSYLFGSEFSAFGERY